MDNQPGLSDKLDAFKASIIQGCEEHWILMVPSSLGEVSAVFALCAAFKQTHGGKICIVADKSRESVFGLFSRDVDLMKFATLGPVRMLSSQNAIDPMRFEVGHPQNLWVNQNRDGRSLALHELFVTQPGRGGLSFMDLMRYAMNLPWDAPVSKGMIGSSLHTSALEFAHRHGVEPGNSVVLFPGNNTNKPAPADFWNVLSRKYAAAGKKVFYCLSGAMFKPGSLDIHGVELSMSPGMAVAVCEIAGHSVSGANGLMMLFLLTDTTFSMDVILTDGRDVVGNFVFTPADPRHSSSFRCVPDLLDSTARRYTEWTLTDRGGPVSYIADAMVRLAASPPT